VMLPFAFAQLANKQAQAYLKAPLPLERGLTVPNHERPHPARVLILPGISIHLGRWISSLGSD
jgi:hypothetical protein